MATSSLRLLFPPKSPPYQSFHQKRTCIHKCSANQTNPSLESEYGISSLDMETQKKLSLLKEQQTSITQKEPPNFEIGWKRTKPVNSPKPKGWQIADFVEKLESLVEREYGYNELLAKVGFIVADRSREEMEVLRSKGEIDQRMAVELERVLKLMEIDFKMVKAAVKEETIKERVVVAKGRCRQAILVALSF